ncbi:MAG: DUF2283 domain-containing protein [Deferrisomatales bacterium]
MEISYDEKDDILFIRFNDEPIVQDVSYGWNVNIGMTARDIGQVTLLDAREAEFLPIHLSPELRPALRFDRPPSVAAG